MEEGAQRLTIIGDVSVDIVLGPLNTWPRIGTETFMDRSELRAGGSAANAALAASYLGGRTRLLSIVGDDAAGAWLREQLRDLGASLEVCRAPTTLSVGLIHSCGERTIFTTRGHLEQFSYELVRAQLAPAPPACSIALLAGVFLTPLLRSSYPRLIDDLNTLGYQVALDTNWPPQDWSAALRADVARWICKCDHVLLNDLEVCSLADEPELERAIERLTALLKPAASLVVKKGASGAVGVQPGRRVECAAPQAEVFDTTGAGDSFNAGYLLARLAGSDLAVAVASGCRAASTIIARFPRRSISYGELAQLGAQPAAPAVVPT